MHIYILPQTQPQYHAKGIFGPKQPGVQRDDITGTWAGTHESRKYPVPNL